MVVDKDLHRLSTIVGPGSVNESEQKKEKQEETQLPAKPKPLTIKKVSGEKKIIIKPKVKQVVVAADGVEQCD
jgi:hypothetical protein